MSPPGSPPLYPSSLGNGLTDDDNEDLAAVEQLLIPSDDEIQELSGSAFTSSVALNTDVVLSLQDDIQLSTLETSVSFSAATPTPEFAAITLAEDAPAAPPTDTPPSPPAASIHRDAPHSPNSSLTPRKGCQDTVDKFISAQDSQSPSKHEHTDAVREQDMGKVLDTRELLRKELLGKIIEVDVSWARNLYEDVPKARAAKIKGYLEATEEYRNKRWVRLPLAAQYELDLYDPFTNIINSILRQFNLAGPHGSRRKAVDTHAKQLGHGGRKPTSHRSSPDISIRGAGPSFTRPMGNREIGYSNMVGFADVKREEDVTAGGDDHVGQLGVYSRQSFIQQPNRRYVRCLLVTEKRARFYHFDRSGVQYTKLFDIHEEAELFVLLVVGLCTTDERLLGLDDTVQWTIGADGRRTGGTLRTVGPDQAPITYTLSTDQMPWVRSSILGRGIVCWPVQDKKGECFIVKDYWMSQGREPEYEILEQVKGKPGLCQIVSYEIGRGETKDFRGPTDSFGDGAFHNSIAIRIIMKKSVTGPIDNFTSPEELLAALRDAIDAHRTLVSNGLFHREICYDSVLIGLQGVNAKVGERGVLMHLDLAIKPLRTISEFCSEVKTRMPLFESWIMLKACSLPEGLVVIPAHNYLDDLEAFFWLLCYLVLMHEPTGRPGPPTRGHAWVKGWMSHSTVFDVKNTILTSDSFRIELGAILYAGWRDICLDLIVEFRDLISRVSKAKGMLIFKSQTPAEDGTARNRFSDVLKDVNEIYDRVIGLFDDALKKALDQSTGNAQNPLNVNTNANFITNAETVGAEALERVGTGKRPATELDPDSDVEASPAAPKRVCPPTRIPGPSGFSLTDDHDD